MLVCCFQVHMACNCQTEFWVSCSTSEILCDLFEPFWTEMLWWGPEERCGQSREVCWLVARLVSELLGAPMGMDVSATPFLLVQLYTYLGEGCSNTLEDTQLPPHSLEYSNLWLWPTMVYAIASSVCSCRAPVLVELSSKVLLVACNIVNCHKLTSIGLTPAQGLVGFIF